MAQFRLKVAERRDWLTAVAHSLIWLILWHLIRYFTVPSLTKDNDHVIVNASIAILGQSIFIFYLLGYLVFPRFLFKMKLLALLLILLVLFQIVYVMNYFVFRHLASISNSQQLDTALYVSRVWHQFMSPFRFFGCLTNISVAFINYTWSFFFVTPLLVLKVTIDVVRSKTRNLVLERDLLRLETANLNLVSEQLRLQRDYLSLEVSFLRSQVNPHFLFNNLNSVYGKLIDVDTPAANIIVKLAGLMRYSLYVSSANVVPIDAELEYIRNYVDLEKDSCDELLDIKYEELIDSGEYQIAPLILITFVENAFKHVSLESRPFVYISTNLHENYLVFIVLNSISMDMPNTRYPNPRAPKNSGRAKNGGGVGLENVRKRLDILYQNNYQLDITKENGTFKTVLTLKKPIQL